MQQSYLGVADDPTYFTAHHLVGSRPVMHAPASMRAEEYLPTQIRQLPLISTVPDGG